MERNCDENSGHQRGSSSLKYQLIDMNGEKCLPRGFERIGIDGKFTHKTFDGRVITKIVNMPNHLAFDEVKMRLLLRRQSD